MTFSTVKRRPNVAVVPYPRREDANAYLALLCDALGRADILTGPLPSKPLWALTAGQWAAVHLHWPEDWWNKRKPMDGARGLLSLTFVAMAARLRGSRVVITRHNVHPHEIHTRIWFARLASKITYKMATDIIHLTSSKPLPGSRNWITRHGVYSCCRRDPVPGDARRSEVGFFGQLRGYKGVTLLPQLARHFPHVNFVVAGEARDSALLLRLTASAPENMCLLEGRLDAAQLCAWLDDTKIVLLPYRQGLISGSALEALGHGCRIVTFDTPFFRELAAEVGPGWVFLAATAADLSATLSRALEHPDPPALPNLSSHDWNAIAETHAKAYGRPR